MFEASHPFFFFDYFRVPYEVALTTAESSPPGAPNGSCARLRRTRCPDDAPSLYWALFDPLSSPTANFLPPHKFHLHDLTLFGQLVPDSLAEQWLVLDHRNWRVTTPIRNPSGHHLASLWCDDNGSLFLPFDPNETITNYLTERYRNIDTPPSISNIKRYVVRSYYRLRPALPRALQISMRRHLAYLQARTRFPRWPIETALHDFYDFLFRIVTSVAGEPVPWISTWPGGYSWSLVLTHDVEGALGYRQLPLILDLEAELGYRSSWNFVPKRYKVEDELVDALKRQGFEIGVHGLYHDGRDLESFQIFSRRLPEIRRYAARWRAAGFRSPATHRVWDWMPLLGFDYDSSYPDTDPFEPQSGGCCTWLPFFNGELTELPITLPQDHTLFVLLGHTNERIWIEKAEHLKQAGGMALLITHPDYLTGHQMIQAYRGLLETYRQDDSLWKALPGEVSAWWRRRASSSLEPRHPGWRVVGPAASEARVELTKPSPHALSFLIGSFR